MRQVARPRRSQTKLTITDSLGQSCLNPK